MFSEDSSNIPIIRIRDVKRGYSETYYSGNFSDDYIVSKGDLLIGMDGEFNIAKWKSNDALLNQRVCKVTVREDVDEEYIRYALSKKLKEIERKTSFVTVKHLSAKVLNQLELSIPSLYNQNQISNILNNTESIIRLRRSELSTFDKLIKARFCELFESDGRLDAWESRTLLKCCKDKDDIKCGPFGSQLHAEDYIKEGIPVYGIPEVNSAFTAEPRIFVSPEKAGLLQAYNIKEGDIAVSRKGNVGQAALFSDKNTPGIIHSDVLRVRVNHDLIDANYLIGALHNSQKVLHQIIMVSTGAIMPGINVTKLKNITIDIPPIKLQREYGEFVKQVDKSKLPLQNPAYGYSIFLAINRIYAVRQDIKASAAG